MNYYNRIHDLLVEESILTRAASAAGSAVGKLRNLPRNLKVRGKALKRKVVNTAKNTAREVGQSFRQGVQSQTNREDPEGGLNKKGLAARQAYREKTGIQKNRDTLARQVKNRRKRDQGTREFVKSSYIDSGRTSDRDLRQRAEGERAARRDSNKQNREFIDQGGYQGYKKSELSSTYYGDIVNMIRESLLTESNAASRKEKDRIRRKYKLDTRGTTSYSPETGEKTYKGRAGRPGTGKGGIPQEVAPMADIGDLTREVNPGAHTGSNRYTIGGDSRGKRKERLTSTPRKKAEKIIKRDLDKKAKVKAKAEAKAQRKAAFKRK